MSAQEFFAADGPLRELFPNYTPRKGQVDMALDVEDAIATGGVVMAEGPTGTGKSLAYLIPAIQSGKTVVVCTANIALQEQLMQKDLPLLAEAMGGSFTFALAKGRNNYLCVDRLGKTIAKYAGENPDDEMDELLTWADSTAEGDMSELPFVPKPKNWRRLSVMSDECKGKQCAHYDRCHSVAAKRKLTNSQIIVANYAVVFLNAILRAATGMDLVLPPHQVLVLDEAHKAADIAREHFGAKVRHTQVEWACNFARNNGGDLAKLARDVEKCSERFFRDLLRFSKSRDYRVRLRMPGSLKRLGSEPLAAALRKLAENYARVATYTSDRDDAIALQNGAKNAVEYASTIEAADALEDPDRVFYVDEIPDRDTCELRATPVHIGPVLKELVFDHAETTVITSATIAVDGAFKYISNELGLVPTHEIVAESPFDWAAQAAFVGFPDMPEPNDAGFPDAMCSRVVEVIRQARGRTLCLFTSHRNLNIAYEAVKRARLPFKVLKQGDKPRIQLVEEFRNDVTSVLMGTESFWAGVDVPGESLSCVVMDKLPFPSPDNPVLDALKEQDIARFGKDRTFMEHSVPMAIIQFKQGSGRLLRHVDDRGVIACLDPRIFTKGYGRAFVNSLPPMKYHRGTAAVGDFFTQLVDAGDDNMEPQVVHR